MCGWTITSGAVPPAPVIHGYTPCMGTYSLAAPRVRGISGRRLSRFLGWRLRRLLCRRRRLCRGRRGHAPVAFSDPDVRAVDEVLLRSFPYSTIPRPVAAPVVTNPPPPLNHAVITCQTFGKIQLHCEYVIAVRVNVPLCIAIGLFQVVLQLRLSNGRCSDLTHSEYKVPLMVGCDIYEDFNLLPFFVRLGNGSCRILPRMGVQRLTGFQVVRVSAYTTFAFVCGPLNVKPATVQLVVCVLPRRVKAIPSS